MNVLNKSLAALFGVFAMSSTAFADVGIATISDVSGKVLVNAGGGFVPAAANMVLKSGDSVFVGEQSVATLSYETCAVLLDKPAVVTVSANGGCNVATSIQPVSSHTSDFEPFDLSQPRVFIPTFLVTGLIGYNLGRALFEDENSISVP